MRIGYQKYGTLITLKARGTLEQRLAKDGVKVQWTEFPGGPQLLEGLNVGLIAPWTGSDAEAQFEVRA